MKKILVIGSLFIIFMTGCSGAVPSRTQVQKRQTDSERLEDAVRAKEKEFHRMRGTSRDDPFPGYK